MDWNAKLAWALAEHGRRRGIEVQEGERPDLVLMAVASASWAAGLAALMIGRHDEAEALLRRAAEEYRLSWEIAPPGSWGRPIAAIRCRLIAGDDDGALADADSALDAGALPAGGPIQRYCGTLALLVRGEDSAAEREAETLLAEELEPRAVAEALLGLARGDVPAYARAVELVVESFETRGAYLEDVPVADTTLVLQALARRRGMAVALDSPLLPRTIDR